MTSVLPLQPQELQSISRQTARAASRSLISSLLQVTSFNTAAQILSQVSLILNNYRYEPILGFLFHRVRCLLCGTIIAGRQPYPKQYPCHSQFDGDIREREVITISSVASPEPRIVTLDSNSNDPTIPYGFGSQQPIVSPSLNDLNLPPYPFNVLATMAVIRADDANNPQPPESSIPIPISTPPMNVSTIEG